jgi:hypothetical protein
MITGRWRIAGLKRWINARSRPTGEVNAQKLRERGESLDSITFRDAVAADIPALAELHVTTWNATYRTTRGPTIATRTWQWNQVFAKESRRDFVLSWRIGTNDSLVEEIWFSCRTGEMWRKLAWRRRGHHRSRQMGGDRSLTYFFGLFLTMKSVSESR